MEFDNVRQKIVIRSGDRIEFVEELLKWGAIGAKRQANTVPRLYAPFTAELEIMVNPSTPFKDTHCVRAYPPDHRIYTEQEMESMEWNEFRESVALLGVKGRDRKIMVADYLQAVKSIQQQHII